MSDPSAPAGVSRVPPAHVIVITVGTAGDMYPFLAVATALQVRGHRVSFLGPASHERWAREAGVPFQALGTVADYEAALADPDLWHGRKAFGVIWRSMRQHLRMGAAFMDALPTDERCLLFVHPFLLPIVALARARRPEIPVVAAYLAPANLRTCHDPLTIGPLRIPPWVPLAWRRWLWRQVDTRFIDAVALPDLNAERAAAGLPAVRHFVAHLMETPDLSVTLFPEWYAPTPTDWPRPMVRAGFPLYDPAPDRAPTPELAAFLDAGAPPVVFTAGTGQRHAAAFFARATQAAQHLGVRAVLLTRHREQVPAPLPRDILWQAYLPFKALLPRAAALVHHGGIGTTAEALRAGVPQLVAPFAHDQFDNGARVEALGVGEVSRPGRTRAWERALTRLLSSPAVRQRCDAVAARFAQDRPVERVVLAIESIL